MDQKYKSSLYIIDIIKAAACLMIFFYHCNSLLPGEWKRITIFGEELGNNLFFMVSGFALYHSIREAESFWRWYMKRLRRLLPLLVFFYLLSFISGFISLSSPSVLFTVLIYPSLYWFITAILVFYILLFFSVKLLPRPVLMAAAAVLFIFWLKRPGTMEAYYFIGLSAMISGSLLREALEKQEKLERNNMALFLFILSFAGFIAVKTLTGRGAEGTGIRLILGIAVIMTGLSSLSAGYIADPVLEAFFSKRKKLLAFIKKTGALAFPIYLIQCFNAGMPGFYIGQKIPFPLSFLVNLIFVWGLALIISALSHRISRGSSRIP